VATMIEQNYGTISYHRMTGMGVGERYYTQPPPVQLSQKEIEKLIARRKGTKVRSGYTTKKPTKKEIQAKRKKEKKNRKTNR